MGYLGSTPMVMSPSFSGVNSQAFSPNGSTVNFTLSRTVAFTKDIEVIVDNVQQSPYDGSYSVSGTTLTFSENPPAGTNSIYVIYRDAPILNITDTTAVKKAGDTMTGALTLPNLGIGSLSDISTANRTITHQNGGKSWYAGLRGDTANAYSIADDTAHRFLIDNAGRANLPFQPAFHVIRTSGDVAASTVVIWNTVVLNTGNCYNATTGIFTAPVAGRYFLHTRMNSSGVGIHPQIAINDVYNDYYRGFGYSSGGGAMHASVTAIIQMAAGDTARVNTGGYSAMQGNPGYNNGFCGYLLG